MLKIDFKITDEQLIVDNYLENDWEYQSTIEEFHEISLRNRKSDIKRWARTLKKYPKSTVLKNYLIGLYYNTGSKNEAYLLAEKTYKEHPDYIHNIACLVTMSFFLKKKTLEEIKILLGSDFNLQKLAPKREVFHVSEVQAYYSAVVKYYIESNDLEKAQKLFQELKESFPNYLPYKDLDTKLSLALIKDKVGSFFTEDKSLPVVKETVENKGAKIEEPVFHCPKQIKWLYDKEIYNLEENELNEILNLPRKELIEDLVTLVEDSIDRYLFFQSKKEVSDFLSHAIFILSDVAPEKSKEIIFKVLNQSSDYIEFYCGSYFEEEYWEPFYRIFKDDLSLLNTFLFTPGVGGRAKTVIAEVIVLIPRFEPERHEEVVHFFEKLLNDFLTAKEDNLIDVNFLGMLMWQLTDLKSIKLLKTIEKLFEKNYISKNICGDYKDVQKGIKEGESPIDEKRLLNIQDRYKELKENYGFDNVPEQKYELPSIEDSTPKIGRNDPCYCGSGKKYKKCCM